MTGANATGTTCENGDRLYDEPMTTVGVVVVTYRSSATIEGCLRSLRAATATNAQVVVVDNASDDDSAEVASALGATVIRRDTNAGFGAGCNEGVRALDPSTEFVLFANPDTTWPLDQVDALIREAKSDPSVGLISPTLVDENNTTQPIVEDDLALGRVLRGMTRLGAAIRPRVPSEPKELEDVEWLHMAAALVPMSVVHETGGFDERFFMFGEDADFCRRVRGLGRRVVVSPRVFVTHIGGASVDGSHDADQAAGLRTRALALYLEKYQGVAARRVFGLVGAVVYSAARHRGQAREAWKALVG